MKTNNNKNKTDNEKKAHLSPPRNGRSQTEPSLDRPLVMLAPREGVRGRGTQGVPLLRTAASSPGAAPEGPHWHLRFDRMWIPKHPSNKRLHCTHCEY